MVRVTGVIKDANTRHGDFEGRKYTVREVRVLVADLDFTMVALPDEMPFPAVGSEVDYLVDSSGGKVARFRYKGEFPVAAAAAARPVRSA